MARVLGTNLRDHLTGTIGRDEIFGSGGDDVLVGRTGADTLNGGIGEDVLDGQDGNDTLVGGSGSDKLRGVAGNDTLRGGTGADKLDGGPGDDALYGDAGDDVLLWSAGSEAYIGGTGIDTANFSRASSGLKLGLLPIAGGSISFGYMDSIRLFSVENVVGSAFDDVLAGYSHNADHRLEGRQGDDELYGAGGADTLLGGDGDDRLFPGDDTRVDRIDGGAGLDTIVYGNSGPVVIDLTTGFASGGVAEDVLWNIESVDGAYSAENTIKVWKGGTARGGGLSDILSGSSAPGAGTTETLWGYRGHDTFVLHHNSGADIIRGFDETESVSNSDLLQVSQAEFGITALDILNVASGGATGATAAAQFIFDKSAGILYFDSDGAGGSAAIQIATIYGMHYSNPIGIDLDASNFSLVA